MTYNIISQYNITKKVGVLSPTSNKHISQFQPATKELQALQYKISASESYVGIFASRHRLQQSRPKPPSKEASLPVSAIFFCAPSVYLFHIRKMSRY